MKLKSLLIFVAIVIVLLVFVMARLIALNSLCDSNPFIYGARNLAEQGKDAQCTCTISDRWGAGTIYFDKDGVVNGGLGQDLNKVEFNDKDGDN